MKSNFSITQAFLIPSFIFLFTLGLTTALILAGLIALEKPANDGFFLLGAGLVFLTMCLGMVWHYTRILNQIEISFQGILIRGLWKNRVIKWSEVESIKLTGKETERFMFTSLPMEAVSIQTKDGIKEVVLIKYYSNMDRVRTALHFIKMRIDSNQSITSECFHPVKRTEPSISDVSTLERFGQNHLFTFNGLTVYGAIAMVFWLLVFSNNDTSIFLKLIVSTWTLLLGVGLYGYQLHYFRLNEEFLVIRNHIWFWRRDAYFIKDIREIVFEAPHKMSTSLRVITNNYESKLYPAGSVRTKSWRKLSEQLHAYGVTVRNEAFFE